MKINLIIFISEFNLGGAGNSIFKLCKNLPKKEFQINVICLNKCFYKSELHKIGIKVHEIKSKKTLFAMPKIKKLIKTLVVKKQKNIFLSNIHFSNVLSILFLRPLKIKIILVERTPFEELTIYYNFFDFVKKYIIKFLIRYCYPKANACISNSKYISKKYNKFYNLKFETINPPSFKRLITIPKKLNNKKQELFYGVVSRLSKEKRIDEVNKIFSEINEKNKLNIIGDGLEKNNLLNLTKKLNLTERIKFFGPCRPEKIKFVLRDFDYFINSSDFEGFPNSVVEALSANVPVIASQSHGGINDIIKNKNYGLIYKDKKNLKKILNNIFKKKKIFKKNKKQLINHLNTFSEKNNLDGYIKLFKKI